jgi:hypothetical protein
VTRKSQHWKPVTYRIGGADSHILVHKGDSRYSRWYVIDDSGPKWKYLSEGFDRDTAAFAEANMILREMRNKAE